MLCPDFLCINKEKKSLTGNLNKIFATAKPPLPTPGPGSSELTTLVVNISLKFQTLISQLCQYFLLKKCEKLLLAMTEVLSNTLVHIYHRYNRVDFDHVLFISNSM